MTRSWLNLSLLAETTLTLNAGDTDSPTGIQPFYYGKDAVFPGGEIRLRVDPLEALSLEASVSSGINTRATHMRGFITGDDLLIDATQLSATLRFGNNQIFGGIIPTTMHWQSMGVDKNIGIFRTWSFGAFPYRELELGYRRGPSDGDHVGVRWIPFAPDNLTGPARAYFSVDAALAPTDGVQIVGNLQGGLNADLNMQMLADLTINLGDAASLLGGVIYGCVGTESLQGAVATRYALDFQGRAGNESRHWTAMLGGGFIHQENSSLPHNSFYFTAAAAVYPWNWLTLVAQYQHNGALGGEVFSGVGGTDDVLGLQVRVKFEANYPE